MVFNVVRFAVTFFFFDLLNWFLYLGQILCVLALFLNGSLLPEGIFFFVIIFHISLANFIGDVFQARNSTGCGPGN